MMETLKSLSRTLETNVTLCVNSTQKKKKKYKLNRLGLSPSATTFCVTLNRLYNLSFI